MSGPSPPLPTGTPVPPAYRLEQGVVTRDSAKAARLWRECSFGLDASQEARFDWFYGGSPRGEGQINFLVHATSEQPVGFLGVGQREWILDGAPVGAGVLVDFVVHPQHRTALPALLLQRQGRERALQTAQVLYGLPDTKAVAMFKRLGAQYECRLPRFARVLRSRGYLQRLLPAWLAQPLAVFTDTLDFLGMHLQLLLSRSRGEWLHEFDARFDALWARVNKQGRSIGVRDSAFLTWRFLRQPGREYRIFAVESPADGTLLAYFVCELRGETLAVQDCLFAGTEMQMRHALLRLSLAARRLGASVISIQVCGDALLPRALRLMQFVERDGRPFFATIAPPLQQRAAGAAWYITPADEDI